MKKVISIGAVLLVAACATQTVLTDDGKDETTFQIRTLDGRTQLNTEDYSSNQLLSREVSFAQVQAENLKMEQIFQRLAVRADQANNYANAFLISAALAVALGEVGGVAGSVVEKRIAWALGINEGIKYANPSQVARALRIASLDALCFANVSVAKYPRGEATAQPLADTFDNKTKLLVAMRLSHNNLRERMARDRLGFLSLLNSIRDEKETLAKEDRITLANKLAESKAQNQNDAYFAALMGCLN